MYPLLTNAQKRPSQLVRLDLTICEVERHEELREAILSEIRLFKQCSPGQRAD